MRQIFVESDGRYLCGAYKGFDDRGDQMAGVGDYEGRPSENRDHKRLIVALDLPTLDEAMAFVDLLREEVAFFKVGMELFTATGPAIIDALHKRGCKVFLDLKFHDIPNTVRRTCEVILRLGVEMFNIHALGGSEMMAEAARALHEGAAAWGRQVPSLLAVTILTSIDDTILAGEIGVRRSLEEEVVHLAQLAKAAGVSGVVASPREIRAIRQVCGPNFCIVTPGVRPVWAARCDQRRVMTPEEAVREGADYIVIGRPITGADDPLAAAREVNREVARALLVCGDKKGGNNDAPSL